jgi:hypothetical protein
LIRIILLVLLTCSTIHANELHEKCNDIVDKLLGTDTYDIQREHRIDNCVQLKIAAFIHGVDEKLVLAIAWHESRFTNVYNNCCCYGPMQIDPKIWCENKSKQWSPHVADGHLATCDLNSRGAFAVRYLSNLYGEGTDKMLCSYAGYKDCKNAKGYIDRIRKIKNKIK